MRIRIKTWKAKIKVISKQNTNYMGTLQEDFAEIIEQLNKASKESLMYKGEITINSKGEAQFRARAYSNEPSKISPALEEILVSMRQLCRDKQIKIAGT